MTSEQKEKHKKGVSRWTAKNRGLHNDYVKRTYWHWKTKVIKLLGGKCVNCGISDIRILAINHKQGRHGDKRKSAKLWRDILKGRLPKEDFDVRCMNCNLLYEYERGQAKMPTKF